MALDEPTELEIMRVLIREAELELEELRAAILAALAQIEESAIVHPDSSAMGAERDGKGGHDD
jgi:hypothetical protein